MYVWRLFAQKRRDLAFDASDFYFDYVVGGHAFGAGGRERVLSLPGDS